MAIKKYSSGQWVDTPYRKYETATDTITSLPKTIYGDGQPISAYTIKGNMSQSGTPTPSNLVYPQETGNKTANLFDEAFTGLTTSLTYFPIYVGDGTFTLSTTTPMNPNEAASLFFLAGNVSTGASTQYNGVWDRTSRTVTSSSGYVTIAYRYNEGVYVNPKLYNTMLNEGSTALPYELYGYKLPIVSGGVTTNVYLSEPMRKYSNNLSTYTDSFSDTLTRFVKKIIIDGNSSITNEGGNAPFKVAADGLLLQTTPQMRNTVYWYCSHYNAYPNSASWAQYSSLISWSSNDTDYLRIRDTRFATLADFKNWLQEQSDNGTPVTIWYVLGTPTTETVTAPTIPTTGTAQSFDVDTTLKPSEVSLTYHGWHEHNDTKYT